MKRIVFVLVLVGVFCFYFITNKNELANDYYDTINAKFLSNDYLDDGDYVYNAFVMAQEESNDIRDSIINDIVSGKIKIDNGVSESIIKLYNNVIDYDTRNSIGLGSLSSYIDLVYSSDSIEELVDNVSVIERELSIDIFTRVGVDKDFLDNSKNIVYLYPVSFAFGSSADYFVDDDYMVYKAYIKRAIIRLLEKYGMSRSEARLVSSEVISFYTSISESSNLSSYYSEVTGYYNIVDKDYLKDIYSNIDIDEYLKDKGINENEYSLVDVGQYSKINEYLVNDYLMLWKKVMLVKILSSYASYLDVDYRNIVVDLNDSLTGGDDDTTYSEEAISLVGSVFSNDIDRIYDARVITDDDKEYFIDLFSDIKTSFKEILKNNSWLSDVTKEKALVKLDSMVVYVGGNDVGNSSKYIDVTGDNLIDNIISINKSNYLLSLKRLDDDSDISAMSSYEVNAYYNPMKNAVYIPSSVMFLLNDSNSYYERLGTIGMVIAHEVTHGFDYNGSMFDSKGNLNNWWSDADREKYGELKSRVSDYYSKIEAMDGKYIDGDKTVNENIADMGALKVITAVAIENGASNEDMKVMYSLFAKFWRSQTTEDYSKLLLLNDSHSPNKYRVNAVLSLIDEFYDIYNVYPWNGMYVSNRDRVSVW